MVDETHDDTRCHEQVERLLRELGIAQSDLLRSSYAETLKKTGC